MPLYFHLGSKSLPTLLHLADVRVRLSEGLLLLLPLHGMVLCLVLVHLGWPETSPPDPLLIFTQLALPAPLLGMDPADMVCHPLLMLVHLPWFDTPPPDTLLILAQLTLPAPLLGVDLANMVW